MFYFKSGVIGITNNRYKLLLVIAYTVTASIMGYKLYNALPSGIPFYFIIEKIITTLIVSVGTAGLIFLIKFIGRLQTRKYQDDFLRIHLKNGLGETPQRLSKRRDKETKKGFIITFDNARISIEDFDNKTADLNNILNAEVYHMEYSKTLRKTLVYARKYKKIKVGEVLDDEV
ncbi:MAG: hypothetical protein FWG44_00215 [Oscillospiraceae bacterium]|nr:hypothetical protein [Oscillospiraceae bacterium]